MAQSQWSPRWLRGSGKATMCGWDPDRGSLRRTGQTEPRDHLCVTAPQGRQASSSGLPKGGRTASSGSRGERPGVKNGLEAPVEAVKCILMASGGHKMEIPVDCCPRKYDGPRRGQRENGNGERGRSGVLPRSGGRDPHLREGISIESLRRPILGAKRILLPGEHQRAAD